MSDDNNNMNLDGATTPKGDSAAATWHGMTMEQLKAARAKALIRREVGRVQIENSLYNVKSNVSSNGIRALMFSPGTVSGLKKADYLLLGFRLTRWLMNLRSSRRRRY